MSQRYTPCGRLYGSVLGSTTSTLGTRLPSIPGCSVEGQCSYSFLLLKCFSPARPGPGSFSSTLEGAPAERLFPRSRSSLSRSSQHLLLRRRRLGPPSSPLILPRPGSDVDIQMMRGSLGGKTAGVFLLATEYESQCPSSIGLVCSSIFRSDGIGSNTVAGCSCSLPPRSEIRCSSSAGVRYQNTLYTYRLDLCHTVLSTV